MYYHLQPPVYYYQPPRRNVQPVRWGQSSPVRWWKASWIKWVVIATVAALIVVWLSNCPGFKDAMMELQMQQRKRHPVRLWQDNDAGGINRKSNRFTHNIDHQRERRNNGSGKQHSQSQLHNLYVKTSKVRKRLTKKQKRIVLSRYHNKCAMCHKNLNVPWDIEYDHIISLASDPTASRSDLNNIESFQPLCRRCHGYKCFSERRRGLYKRPRHERAAG